jgi:hypothetical protein
MNSATHKGRMSNTVQYQLGSPLFLCALVVALSYPGSAGSAPPTPQSSVAFVQRKHPKPVTARRRRIARDAIRIAAQWFRSSGIAAPVWACVEVPPEGRLDKLQGWLQWLAQLSPLSALALLSDNALTVREHVYKAASDDFNACFRAELPLQPGALLQHLLSLRRTRLSSVCPVASETVCPSSDAVQGSFYYIGAGVGCGIAEANRVCPLSATPIP